MTPGRPWPLGATLCDSPDAADVTAHGGRGGVNFALWAPDATAVELCLFDAEGRCELGRVCLPAFSEGVWHGWLGGVGAGSVYGWRVRGPWAPERGHRFNPAKILLDPYAQEIVGRYTEPAGPDVGLYLGHDAQEPGLPDGRDNAAVALKARVVAPSRIA